MSSYSYQIQVGDSSCKMSFDADSKDVKPSSQLSCSGSPEAIRMLRIIMAESSSVSDFEKNVGNHGGTSWIVDPNASAPSSSGMSWGSSSASDDDE